MTNSTRSDDMARELGEAFVNYCYANELDDDMDYWTTEQEAGWFNRADAITAKYK